MNERGKRKKTERRWIQLRYSILEEEQGQGELVLPGNSYLALKSVIYALTTGLPLATFPLGSNFVAN